jgi:hypothetical protein
VNITQITTTHQTLTTRPALLVFLHVHHMQFIVSNLLFQQSQNVARAGLWAVEEGDVARSIGTACIHVLIKKIW